MWAKVVEFLRRSWLKILIAVVVVALVVMLLAGLRANVDPLLSRLRDKDKPYVKAVGIANSVPPGRIGADGKPIPVGTPDEVGMTQAVVVPVQPPGPFQGDGFVDVIPPGKDPIRVQLPTGVKAADVETVIIVKPNVVAVSVRDDSGVSPERVDDLLARLR